MTTHYLVEISKGDWKGNDRPLPDDVVGGEMYPTCVACHEGSAHCIWIFGVVQHRMQHTSGGGADRGSCEVCRVQGIGCDFVWEPIHALRKIDDTMERLVQHARSENRKAGRRIADNDAAREWLGKALADLK